MDGFTKFGLLLLGLTFTAPLLVLFRKPVVAATQSFAENKSAGSANHSLANHIRPSYHNASKRTAIARDLSEAHNHSIYDKHFNMMRSGGALEAQYQYGVGANNILLNHSQRLRILQNGGP